MGVQFFPATGAHDDRPDLDVNVANGRTLLDMLGLIPNDEAELSGICPAGEFAARVKQAQELLPLTSDAEGTPAVQDGDRWFSGGRRPGYLADRLAVLAKVAQWAARHDAPVCWG